MSNLKAIEYKTFEAIKHLSEDGGEYWYTRELASVLEYVQWRNFVKVLDRAKLACNNSGYGISDHFAEGSKTIEMPKTISQSLLQVETLKQSILKKEFEGKLHVAL